MVETLTKSNLFNSFAVFREILKGITSFVAVFPKANFDENDRYFEDEPTPKSREFVGYPLIIINTEMDDSSLTIKDKKQMAYTTTVSIQTEYFTELATPRLNDYMNEIVEYFNANKSTLRKNYGLVSIKISKSREQDEIAESKLVIGILTFNYHTTLDVS